MTKYILATQVFFLFFYLRISINFRSFKKIILLIEKTDLSFFFNKDIKKNIKVINKISTFLPGYTCLLGSSILKMISNDLDNLKLVIGISNDEGFESHAWIEKERKIIFGKTEDIDKFKPILFIK